MEKYVSKNTLTFDWSTEFGKKGKKEMNKKKKKYLKTSES